MRTRKILRTHDARGGFTLIEMMIAGVILALVLGGVGVATLSARRAYQGGVTSDSLTVRAQRALDRVADLVLMTNSAQLGAVPAPPLATNAVQFATPSGWSGSAITWGSTTRIEFQYTATDPNDGFDNDGDGFVDDGDVVLTLDRGTADERAVVLVRQVAELEQGELANGIDDNGNGLVNEQGLNFSLNGNQLTISLTLVGRDADGRDVVRTVSTAVTLRN